MLSDQPEAGKEELGEVVGDHDDPGENLWSGEQKPVAEDAVAEEEQGTGYGDQDAREGISGYATRHTDGAQGAEHNRIENQKGKLLSGLLPPAIQQEEASGQQQDEADDMGRREWESLHEACEVKDVTRYEEACCFASCRF